MSLSWINKLIMNPQCIESAGLVIGSRGVARSRIKVRKNSIDIREYGEKSIDLSAFVGNPTQQVVKALNEAMVEIAGDESIQYIPLHVSLPDAAMHIEVLEFVSLPQKQSEQQELINWRIHQDSGAIDIVCASQNMGFDNGKHLVLVLSVKKEWFEVVVNLLKNAHLIGWSISADALRQFNRYHDRLISGSGALINFNDECWSLLLWDSHGRVRHFRSQWRNNIDELVGIAYEIERAIIAYVHGASNRSIDGVYLVIAGKDNHFADVIDSRLSKPCVRLSPLGDISTSCHISLENSYIAGALAAAMER